MNQHWPARCWRLCSLNRLMCRQKTERGRRQSGSGGHARGDRLSKILDSQLRQTCSFPLFLNSGSVLPGQHTVQRSPSHSLLGDTKGGVRDSLPIGPWNAEKKIMNIGHFCYSLHKNNPLQNLLADLPILNCWLVVPASISLCIEDS